MSENFGRERRSRQSLLRMFALLLALTLFAASCGSDGDDSSASTDTTADSTDTANDSTDGDSTDADAPADPTTIRIVPWGGMFIDFIDLYVGEEMGYFAEEGVVVEQLPGAGAGDAVQQVLAGNADIAMADPFSGFFAVAQGADLEGFYCPYTKNWLTMIVNNAAGISEPADLAGQTIAVTSQASTSKWYAQLLLAANGVDENDVTFAATGIDFGSALLAGEAQAASTWGSINWALFDAGGFGDTIDDYEIWEYEQVPGPNDVYFADRGWLDENDDAVAGFIRALEKSKAFVADNPDDAAEIGSRYAVGADNMERNRAVIDFRIDMQNTGPGVADNGIGWCDVPTISDIADQGVELGILEQAVDVGSIITNRYHNG